MANNTYGDVRTSNDYITGEFAWASSADINSNTSTVQVLKTPLGKFIDKITSPFTKLSSDFKEKKAKGETISFKTLLIFIIIFGLLFYFILGPIITIGVTGLLSYRESKKALDNISEYLLPNSASLSNLSI